MARLLEALGIRRRPAAPREARTTLQVRLEEKLAHLGSDRVEMLAAFAGLLARGALGDAELSPAEERAMAEHLRSRTGLSEPEAELVADVAREAAESLAGIEDHLLTRTFNAYAGPEEKEHLIDCLYAVAAADGLVSSGEDEEIKRIARALLVPHSRVMDLRSRYRDQISVLRDLPG